MTKVKRKKLCNACNARRNELVREIKYLRSITKDVVDRYSLNVYAGLANLERILEPQNRKKHTIKKPTDKMIRQMLSCVRSLRVKPKKGRAKDLMRIEAIAKELDNFIPSQP